MVKSRIFASGKILNLWFQEDFEFVNLGRFRIYGSRKLPNLWIRICVFMVILSSIYKTSSKYFFYLQIWFAMIFFLFSFNIFFWSIVYLYLFSRNDTKLFFSLFWFQYNFIFVVFCLYWFNILFISL